MLLTLDSLVMVLYDHSTSHNIATAFVVTSTTLASAAADTTKSSSMKPIPIGCGERVRHKLAQL